ncbi:aspartic peptidase A1 [Cyathus striatus]|nr:aspartic peptidase A1 [Cyathus striatus]
MPSLIPLSLLLLLFQSSVHAVRVPFQIRATHIRTSTTQLAKRASPIPISNTGNAQYVSNITLGGIELPVLLDTGSSDLWVHFPDNTPSNLTDTGKSITLSYAVGKAEGNVQTTTLQFGNHTVENQAFLLVTDTSTFTSDIHSQGYDGLLGLGPNDGSVIKKKLSGHTGDSMLMNIFDESTTTDNYITILLDRKGDPADAFTGQFTIGEVVPGFENVTSMPQLDVETVSRLLKSDQHWQALTDKDNGIIGPDGNPIQQDSIVPKAPDGQYVAVIDSGFTFSQVPRDISDAIYGRVQGAVYDSTNEYWTIPCGQYLNITFMFGGKPYPVHPLDVVDDNFGQIDSTGKRVCIGAFQPITSAFSILGNYDMILGMSFLRSAYTLLNFGEWTDDKTNEDPYIQMASIADYENAKQDFITVRLGGVDTTGDSKWDLLPADQMQHSPVSAEEKKKKYQEMILSRWPYIVTGCLVFIAIILGLCIWRCCCRRGKKNNQFGNNEKKGFFSRHRKGGKPEPTSYLPLQDPSRSQVNLAYPTPPYQPGHNAYEHGGQGYTGQNH